MGLYESVGCARQQSEAARNDFRELEVATQKHKKLPKSRNYFMSRAGA